MSVPEDVAPYTVLLFDGECNLCNGAVDFVIRRDRDRYFRYASLQSETGKRLRKPFDPETAATDSVMLLENGKLYVRSTAALRIARHLGAAWPLTAVFYLIPWALRDRLYDVVAANRYRWFGKRDTCRLPGPEERDLFL